MVKHTIVQLRDDLDGGAAAKTVQFAWSGSTYEIDLSTKNAKAFEQALAPYIASARRLTTARRGPAKKAATAAAGAKRDLTAVRAWAAKNGHVVAARGRVPAVIMDAFHAAEAGLTGAIADGSPARTAKKTTARPVAKKTAAKRTAAKKTPAKKASARKASARKSGARKATASKSAR